MIVTSNWAREELEMQLLCIQKMCRVDLFSLNAFVLWLYRTALAT